MTELRKKHYRHMHDGDGRLEFDRCLNLHTLLQVIQAKDHALSTRSRLQPAKLINYTHYDRN